MLDQTYLHVKCYRSVHIALREAGLPPKLREAVLESKNYFKKINTNLVQNH